MTITDVKLISETGSRTLNGGPTYERTYHVYFNSGYSVAAMLNNTEPELEKPGDDHPEDPSAIAITIKPELHEDSAPDEGIALYTVSFAAKTTQYELLATHPLDRDPIVSGVGGIDINEAVRKDSEGKKIVNSAKDFYDPTPERPKRGGSYTITFNTADHPGALADGYSNTLNSDSFYGCPAGTCMIAKITWSLKSEVYAGETVTYYEVTVPLSFCPDGFRFKPVDNGFRKLNTDSKPETHIDGSGHAPSVPILLNGSGAELAVGADPVIYPTDGYKVFFEVAFAGLSLPNPFA